MPSTPTALSLFSGIGGLDLGARAAGMEVLLATDIDAGALELLKRGTGATTLAGSIEEIGPQLLSTWPSDHPPDLVIGGPPCTGFSHAGFWIEDKRAGLDPATNLLQAYLGVITEFRPRGFILENVPGLAFKTHERFLVDFVQSARLSGYSVTFQVLNASKFGVAQARRRLFVVGMRDQDAVDLTVWPLFPERSSRWAIGDLDEDSLAEPNERLSGKYAGLLPLVPPGGNYLHFTGRYGWDPPLFRYRGRYWSFLLKIDPNRPSPTVPAQRVTFNGPFHWDSRHLRIRELARLQGFPDDYPLDADLTTARRHIGNAVPPVLAAAIVWRVLSALGCGPEEALPPVLQTAADPNATFSQVTSTLGR